MVFVSHSGQAIIRLRAGKQADVASSLLRPFLFLNYFIYIILYFVYYFGNQIKLIFVVHQYTKHKMKKILRHVGSRSYILKVNKINT